MTARYDGHAAWYDDTFAVYADTDHAAGFLSRLVGPAPASSSLCLDIGCGTGLLLPGLRDLGWRVVGMELSADQLRRAAWRHRPLVQADARRLPVADRSADLVTMTFTHTDVDDFPTAIAEACRVLRGGGRLALIGVHPAYVGAFVDRSTEREDRSLTLAPGYGNEDLQVDPTGVFPVRSRVGARNLTLGTLIGAFVVQPRLRLAQIHELDTLLRPWSSDATDGRIAPWNLALVAEAL